MTPGEKLKQIRKAKGLSQAELGSIIGVHNTAISQWEKGRLEIIDERIPQLAQAFGMTEPKFRSILNLYPVDINADPSFQLVTPSEFASRKQRLDDAASWTEAVATSDLPDGVRFILLCLPAVADDGIVALTHEEFAERLNFEPERIARDWPKVLETDFVETVGSASLGVIRLKY